MIRGLYAATSAMLSEAGRTDTIANNLANANTTGFKKDVTITKDFASMLIDRIRDGNETAIGSTGAGSLIDENATIQSQGSLKNTGGTVDFAIDGKGYFTVETPNGVRYTRNGEFTQNARGELVTLEGNRVLSNNGPVRLNGSKLTVDAQGNMLVDGQQRGRLQVTEFADERQLVKEGNSLFSAPAGQAGRQATGSVRQGFLENSNVNVVSEMVNLISAYRAYEVNSKVIQSHDQLLDKAANEVGKV